MEESLEMISGVRARGWEVFCLVGIRVGLWLLGLLLLAGLCGFIYRVLASWLRRRERAWFFLDLLETGASQGRSFEHTVAWFAQSCDHGLGVYFYLLAAYIEKGHQLEGALREVPSFLPRRLNALFEAARRLGDMRRVLPVCRRVLEDGASRAFCSQNNLGVVLFSLPLGALVLGWCSFMIVPRFQMITVDMLGAMPPLPGELFSWSLRLAAVSAVLWLLFFLASALQSGGPRFLGWAEWVLSPVTDWLEVVLPWRYKRLQRDFSAMLALLLDSGVPESEAVEVAAQATGNRVFLTRAGEVVHALSQGQPLVDAIQWLDRRGEFKWRLQTAAGAGRPSLASALAGWHEALDARAFAQEQAVSQVVTTGMVFLNGVMVGLMAMGLFHVLLAILEEGLLW